MFIFYKIDIVRQYCLRRHFPHFLPRYLIRFYEILIRFYEILIRNYMYEILIRNYGILIRFLWNINSFLRNISQLRNKSCAQTESKYAQ
jgi:hypothetical protein